MSTLYRRMLEAADTLAELNALYDLGDHFPWEPETLRREAPIVLSGETL